MKINLFVILICFFSLMASAQTEKRLIAPSTVKQKWVKLNCIGPITPMGVYPIEYDSVMTAFLPFNSQSGLDVKRIFFDSPKKFQDITNLCSVRRYGIIQSKNVTSNYLQWATDYSYERYEASVFEFYSKAKTCRDPGQPCSTTKECCPNVKRVSYSCNSINNTCESSAKIANDAVLSSIGTAP